MSRREVIKKVGFASMIALPIITGIVAPTAAHAQSGTTPVGGACTTTADCQAGSTCKACFNSCPSLACCRNSGGFAFGTGVGFGAATDQASCKNDAAQSCCSGTGTFNDVNCVCN